MGPQIVCDHDRGAAPGTGPVDGSPYLGTEDISSAAWRQAAIEPARAPINEPEAIDLVVGPGGLDQPLPTAAFATPHAGQGGMERELDFILQIHIGTGEERQEFVQIWRHFSEEVGLDKGGDGWRSRRASPSQDHLHPQAFPT